MGQSRKTTDKVLVEVQSRYLPEHSIPVASRWMFAYTICITNHRRDKIQLLSRHWIITDANGSTQEVHGDGVVGEQPVILPGLSYEYTSFCPLESNFGTMHGSYRMIDAQSRPFMVEIAPFSLDIPHTIH